MSTRVPRRRSLAGRVSLVLAGFIVVMVLFVGLPAPTDRVWLAAMASICALIVGWAVLQARADRRAYETDLAARAGERAATEQRLAIARDLHDTVSHQLGTITMRAAVAARLPEREEAGAALHEIETMSRQATEELRHMLGVLRSDTPAPRRPAPSLQTVTDLVEDARNAGLDLRVAQEPLGSAPEAVEVAVHRIVQESLANTVRYAGPTSATVHLCRDHDRIEVTVLDDGPVPGWTVTPGSGSGVAGMRERVENLGGTLTTGPVGDGWRVHASLPTTAPTGQTAAHG